MNLKGIREQVIARSGRTDLVGQDSGGDPDYRIDAGVDALIHQAQKFLCDRAPWLCPEETITATLETGSTSVQVPLLKEVHAIVGVDSSESALSLIRATYRDLHKDNLETGTLDSGGPTYWALHETFAAPIYQSIFTYDVDGWTLTPHSGFAITADTNRLKLTGAYTPPGPVYILSPAFTAYTLAKGVVRISGRVTGDFKYVTLQGSTGAGFVDLLTIEHKGDFTYELRGSTLEDYTQFRLSIMPEDEAVPVIYLEDFRHGVDATVEIIFNTTSDADYTISLVGRFYPEPLLAPTDETYISQTHPYFLIDAALYIIETTYGGAGLEELTALDRQLAQKQTDWLHDRGVEWENSDGVLTFGGEMNDY